METNAVLDAVITVNLHMQKRSQSTADGEDTFCISRLGLFSERETGLLAACGAYATGSGSVLLRPCPRQLGGAVPARQLAARSRSPSSCAGEPAPSCQGLAPSWLPRAGVAVPVVTAARVPLRPQEKGSHR